MQQTFQVNKPVAYLFDFLTDMKKFSSIHPVITRIDSRGGNKYLVHETLKFGFIPFSFTYPVVVDRDLGSYTIKMAATVMRLTHIDISFSIKEEAGFSLVHETIEVRTFLPIGIIVKKIICRQHKVLFKNIDVI